MRLRRALTTLAALALIPALSSCGSSAPVAADGTELPLASSDELTNLTAAVHAANPDNPWWPHVNDKIRGGLLADTKIYTDYTAESTEDMVQLVALCDAFLNQIATSTSLVAVYGTVTHHELKIDGSVEEHFDERYKLASGGKSDGEGACLANPYYENVLDELMKLGVETQVFSTKASEPGEVQG